MREPRQAEVRLCLSMIVKNESRVIERCLASVLPLVQGYVISDTGSTDDTKEKIRKAGKEHRVPGLLVDDPWKNFGHNRTRAAAATRTFVKEKRWPLENTYFLTVDADMVLVKRPGFDRQKLTAVYYNIEQVSPDLSWFNTRLCRLSHEWTSVGVTHEYWSPSPNAGPVNLLDLFIRDIGDGGAKGDKTARDIKLLTDGIAEEPNNARYHFYLAQSYWDIGNHAEAIKFYEKRRSMGGYHEEVWYCLYKLGRSELARGNEDRGVALLLQAHEERPDRAEPLAHLARYFRDHGKNHLAVLFARQALRLPVVKNALFVEVLTHHQMPLEDIAVSAYYTSDKEAGFEAAETLLGEHIPGHTHTHMAQCASFYVKPLAPLAIRKGEFTVAEELRSRAGRFFGLEEPSKTTYLPSNPTIVEHKGRIFANVRLVNYYHERGRVFASKDPDGVIRTRNVIQELDPETMRPNVEVESEVDLPKHWDHTTRVRGLEDQRWCSHAGRIWLTATCFNIPGAGGQPRVILGRVSEDLDGIDYVTSLQFSGTRTYEKNWLPWSRHGKLQLIYGYSPFAILDVEVATGDCRIASATVPPFATDRWRGSAAPIQLPGNDRWLLSIHETAWFEGPATHDQRTVYMHRFVEVTGDQITRRSRLFTLDHAGVEYVAGLLPRAAHSLTARADSVIVTHSIEESSAHWKEFSLDTVERLLNGERP